MADILDNLAAVGSPTRTRVTSTRRVNTILKDMEISIHRSMTAYCARQKGQSQKFRPVDMVTGLDVIDGVTPPKDFTTFFEAIN